MAGKVKKTYEYKAVVIEDRGHLSDPEFLGALNDFGAEGWKRSEEQAMGATKLVILFERELVHEDGIR